MFFFFFFWSRSSQWCHRDQFPILPQEVHGNGLYCRVTGSSRHSGVAPPSAPVTPPEPKSWHPEICTLCPQRQPQAHSAPSTRLTGDAPHKQPFPRQVPFRLLSTLYIQSKSFQITTDERDSGSCPLNRTAGLTILTARRNRNYKTQNKTKKETNRPTFHMGV